MPNDASINRTGPLAVVRSWPGATVPVAGAATGGVHGAIRTIVGSGFGARTTTAMSRIWIHGSDVRIDGVADTSEQPGGDITTSTVWRATSSDAPIVLDASRTRHSRVSHTYFQKSFVTLNDPGDLYARGLCPASHDKLYLTYWVRNLQHYFSSWIVSHSGVTGAFQTNADYSRGETCTVTLNDATTRTAYVTHVTANFVTLDFNGTSVSSTLLNGATVAGDTSGATCTLVATSAGVDYAMPGAVKEMRAWQPSSAGQPREIITTSWSNNGSIDIDYYDSAGALVGGTGGAGTDLNGLGHHGVGQWERYELEIDFSGPTGVIRRRINGGVVGELAGLDKQYLNPNYGWAVTLLGLDTPGTGSVPRSELGFSQDLGEIYIDNELVRVFIGDAPTYAACTQLEHQYIRSQTDTHIEIEINQGGFTDLTGKYFHVVGPGFVPILEGVPVDSSRTVGTPALQAQITADTVTVTTDGTYNFGGAPEVTLFWSAEDTPTGLVADVSPIYVAGSGAVEYQGTNPERFFIEAVPEMPGGKAWRMGNLDGTQNGTVTPRIYHDHANSTQFFESRITYWPLANQTNALDYLLPGGANYVEPATWQTKVIWNMADRSYTGADTDFYLETGYFWYNGTNKYVEGGSVRSNCTSIGTKYFDSDKKLYLAREAAYNLPYASPILIEAAYDQGSADGVTADGSFEVAVSCFDMSATYQSTHTGVLLSEPSGPTKSVNGFSYPGFLRGNNVDGGANYYDADLYRAIGPNCKARVGLADGPDWYAAKKRCLMLPQSWSTTSITLKRRNGYWDLDQAGQCYLCVIGADGTQIGSVQL